jgi:hypothetical protein
MNIYRVDEHHVVHTCPADDQPHPVDIRRTIVGVILDNRPCLAPIHIGPDTAPLRCSQQEPADRHCDHCRTVVVTGTITTEHLGHDEPRHHNPVAPAVLAPDPCTVCGEPLAAVLADHGRHISCHPTARMAA